MILNVYVDGFNLYYGALRNTPYRWLDLGKFCKFMLPNYSIHEIKYYTAIVVARPHDLDQPVRQRSYIRALETIPNLKVIYGHFLSSEIDAALVTPPPHGSRMVRVYKSEEKGSDVNLATHLLWDAVNNRYDAAAIISNDSDLCEPIRIVKHELGKRIVVINPHRKPSTQLSSLADELKSIKPTTLKACQFPITIKDAVGVVSKPAKW